MLAQRGGGPGGMTEAEMPALAQQHPCPPGAGVWCYSGQRLQPRARAHTHTHTHTLYLLETVGPREAHDVAALSDICRSGGTDVGRGRGCRQMRVYKMRAKPVYQL